MDPGLGCLKLVGRRGLARQGRIVYHELQAANNSYPTGSRDAAKPGAELPAEGGLLCGSSGGDFNAVLSSKSTTACDKRTNC